MKLKLTWLLTLFMAFVMQLSFGQERDITGTVTTATDGLPLPGVTVIVKGTSRGTQTDFDGKYSIKANTGDVLMFSYVSMTKIEKRVGETGTINLSMEDDVAALDEIVITGYNGATNSSKIASALTTVTSEAIEQVPINSIDQILQGNAAGVNVQTGSGQPGQSATIIIRGRSSLNGDVEPLFVIDGLPVDQDNFRSLNQNDIASMSVLKDAAATAIYGNRGAGGVILITTKRGKKNSGLKIQYRTLYGFSRNPEAQFQVMNTPQFLGYQRDLLPGNQFGDGLTGAEIAALPNTDWKDIFFRDGVTESHEFVITQGGELNSSYTSINYFEQEGTTLGSDLQRFSARTNFNGNTRDNKFSYSTGLSVNYSKSSFIVDAARGNNTGGQLDNAFIVPFIGLPYLDPFNADGTLNTFGTVNSEALFADGSVDDPNGFLNTPFLALNTVRTQTDIEREFRGLGTFAGEYRFAKNLSAGANLGIDYTNEEALDITAPGSIRGLITPNPGSEEKGSQSESFFRRASFNVNASLRYENTFFEKLGVNAAVFGEYNYTNTQNAGFTAFGLNPALPGSGAGFTPGETREGDDDNTLNYVPNVFSAENEIALASVFASVDLDWDSRFGFQGTIRRDGTSRFVTNRYGIFWSVAGRWNIDNEDFMQDVDWINTLKLRASYGVTGNQGVGSVYQGRQTVNAGGGYQNTIGYEVGALRDTNIQWETKNSINLGLSFALFNSRISGELDIYDELTTDLFFNRPLSVAGTGFGSTNTNIADMRNQGIDLQIAFDLLRKSSTNNWSIRLRANGNYNRNEIERLPGDFAGNTLRNQVGRPAFTWFLPRWAGVNPANGDPLYLDTEGNVTDVFTNDNSVYLGKQTDPTYTGGFGTDISYKGFTLNTLFAFAADRWRDNSSFALIEDSGLGTFANQSVTMLNAWTTPGQITQIPALSNGGLRAIDGDRYIEDASFLRLRNVTLAYNFSSEMLAKTKLFTGLRVYVQGTNLFTFTKWRGFDPEANTSTAFFDFPVPRQFTMGFDLTF
jgi:TonB-linked SusC/RagA family outer membrane protein